MGHGLKALAVVALFVAMSGPAQALTVLDTGAPGCITYPETPGRCWAVGRPSGSGWQSVGRFQLTGDALINGISWYGSFQNPANGISDFSVLLYAADSIGRPLATEFYRFDIGTPQSTEFAVSIESTDWYLYFNPIKPIKLDENVTYYLSVVDVSNYWGFGWAMTNTSADWWYREGDPQGALPTGSWSRIPGAVYPEMREFAFSFRGAFVPEPGTLALLGLGLAGLGLSRRRRAN